MYVHGLNGMGLMVYDEENGVWVDDGTGEPAPNGGASAPPSTGGIFSDGFMNAIGKALSTWGNVEVAKQQTEAVKARYQTPYGSVYGSPLAPQYYSGYSPFPAFGAGGSIMGLSMSTWLLLAAAGAGAYYLSQK